MVDVLVVLIVASQVALYIMIAYMFHALQRKNRELSSSDLQQALISREDPTREHRIDVATIDAEEEVVRCRICAFANAQRFRFCVICGEKLKLSPTERARARSPLTARQVRAKRRAEWQRKYGCNGQVSWYRNAEQDCFQYPGYVAVFKEIDDEDGDIQVKLRSDGESGSVILKLQNEARMMRIHGESADDANALLFATGPPSSTNIDVQGLLNLSKEDFPSKFAHFVACTSTLIVPPQLEVLKLFLRREYVVEESVEYLSCMVENDTHSVLRIDFAGETAVDAGGVHQRSELNMAIQ